MTVWTAAATAQISIPALIHSNVSDSIVKAENAIGNNDPQQALAIYKTILYPDGVTVAVEHDNPTRRAMTVAAIQGWDTALRGDNPIRLVSANEKPQLLIRWVNQTPHNADRGMGLIELRKEYRWNSLRHEYSISGTIWIATNPPSGPTTVAEQTDVIMHELGHLLGLDDRPEIGPLMGPMERGKPSGKPAADEVDAVLRIRRIARDRIGLIEAYLNRRQTARQAG